MSSPYSSQLVRTLQRSSRRLDQSQSVPSFHMGRKEGSSPRRNVAVDTSTQSPRTQRRKKKGSDIYKLRGSVSRTNGAASGGTRNRRTRRGQGRGRGGAMAVTSSRRFGALLDSSGVSTSGDSIQSPTTASAPVLGANKPSVGPKPGMSFRKEKGKATTRFVPQVQHQLQPSTADSPTSKTLRQHNSLGQVKLNALLAKAAAEEVPSGASRRTEATRGGGGASGTAARTAERVQGSPADVAAFLHEALPPPSGSRRQKPFGSSLHLTPLSPQESHIDFASASPIRSRRTPAKRGASRPGSFKKSPGARSRGSISSRSPSSRRVSYRGSSGSTTPTASGGAGIVGVMRKRSSAGDSWMPATGVLSPVQPTHATPRQTPADSHTITSGGKQPLST